MASIIAEYASHTPNHIRDTYYFLQPMHWSHVSKIEQEYRYENGVHECHGKRYALLCLPSNVPRYEREDKVPLRQDELCAVECNEEASGIL